MDTEQMVELARTIQAEGVWTNIDGRNDDDVFAWVDALLAEHDARVQAERERDEAVESWGSARADLAHAQARVATLEAALRTAERALTRAVYSPDAVADMDVLFRPLSDALKVGRAALGDQVAPTVPPWPIPVHIGDNGAVYPLAAPQVTPEPQRCPKGMCPHCGGIVGIVDGLTGVHLAGVLGDACPGSQQIPRCAESDARPLWNGEPNPHVDRPASLVEGEQE